MTTPPETFSPHNSPHKPRWRFSLGTFMLLSALGLAILANYLQYRQSIVTSNRVWKSHGRLLQETDLAWQKQQIFDTFADDDPNRISVSLVPANSADDWHWQIRTPHHYRLCTAVAQIPATGLPSSWTSREQIVGATWFRAKLYEKSHCTNNSSAEKQAILMSTHSMRHPSNVGAPPQSPPGIFCVELPERMHVWSVAGKGHRESFDPDGPVILLRMRERPPPLGDVGSLPEDDSPCRGFMVWIEKAKP